MKPEQKSICAKCGECISWNNNHWRHTNAASVWLGGFHEAAPRHSNDIGDVVNLVAHLLKVIDEGRELPADEVAKLREEARNIDLELT